MRLNTRSCAWEEYLQPEALARHSATCVSAVNSRTALVFAGLSTSGVSSEVYLLNLSSGSFELQECSGDIEPLFMHSSVLYGGNMYTFGGVKLDLQCSATMYCLNIEGWVWRSLSTFSVGGTPMKMCGHSTYLWKDKMIVYGGTDTDTTLYSSVFVYDFERRWGQMEGSHHPAFCGKVLASEDIISVIGGMNLLTQKINRKIQEITPTVISWFQ